MVEVKHDKWFWCEICDIHVNNRYDRDFTIGRWGEHKSNGEHKKALADNIAIAEMKKRENSGDILNKKEKKQLNFGKNSSTLPLTDFFSKKRKNGSGGTKTPSVDGVANGLNAKTDLANSLPPKRNVQTCEGIFVHYIDIYFQENLSAYIQYASIVENSLYKFGCVG